ncbi:hypothetical protein CA13_16840 [Planctomycetes bacterium CA13]|uniref:Uncharacterized protein n=1 Tax=Novipirellula herctigrandis TaxID=2527986 RepID=A0A5C5Z0E3_9BACT|nr:hypothetical protein CA13_16840 [Planctomycetes bacterium CA13]
MVFTLRLAAHLRTLATGCGIGTISRSSGIARFVQGGVVKTYRYATKALKYKLLYITAEEISIPAAKKRRERQRIRDKFVETRANVD